MKRARFTEEQIIGVLRDRSSISMQELYFRHVLLLFKPTCRM